MHLHNAHFVDVSQGSIHPAGTTLRILGGRIAELGRAGLPLDPGSVDLGHRYVIPALHNTHTHLDMTPPSLVPSGGELATWRRHAHLQPEWALRACAARGIGTVRDSLTEDLEVNRSLSGRVGWAAPRIRQAVYVGVEGSAWTPVRTPLDRVPNLLAGRPFVPYDSPRSGVVVFRQGADRSTVRDAVDRAVDERGAAAIKIYEQRVFNVTYAQGALLLDLHLLDTLVDRARARGVPTTMHHGTVETFRRACKVGVTSLAHLAIDGPLTEEDARALLAAGSVLEPTVSVHWALCWNHPDLPGYGDPRLVALDRLRRQGRAEALEGAWCPELAPLAAAGLARLDQGVTRGLGFVDMSRPLRYLATSATVGRENFRLLYAAGVPMSLSNDAGVPPLTASMLGLELSVMDLYLDGRLDPARALRMATLDGARALGVGETEGLLAPGRRADLVVLDRDPLQDWRILGRPVAGLLLDGVPLVRSV